MQQTVELNGCLINYDVTGEGKPLILMHGWGCDHTTVASVARVAAETHKVYNIDLPGFGKSPEPETALTVEGYTDIIEAFIDKLGLEKPVLAGHSYGGRVSILLASRRAVDKVVLIDAAGVKPRRSMKYYIKVWSFKLAKKFWKLVLGPEKAEARIEAARQRKGSADYAAASPVMRRALSLAVNHDLTGVMPLIKAPTLLIWGENDTATPLSDAKLMEKLIPDAGLVSFPGCGHYSFLDNPQGFAAVLRSFLRS